MIIVLFFIIKLNDLKNIIILILKMIVTENV